MRLGPYRYHGLVEKTLTGICRILLSTSVVKSLFTLLFLDFQSGVISSTPLLPRRGAPLLLRVGIRIPGLLLPTTISSQTCRAINCSAKIEYCLSIFISRLSRTASSSLSSCDIRGKLNSKSETVAVNSDISGVVVKTENSDLVVGSI